jgi:hypothetical protein
MASLEVQNRRELNGLKSYSYSKLNKDMILATAFTSGFVAYKLAVNLGPVLCFFIFFQ